MTLTKRTIMDMAREAGFKTGEYSYADGDGKYPFVQSIATGTFLPELERFEKLVREDEREACAKVCEEFARKWWKIHCDSNIHYSSTLKAHQDFCALQAAIRARGKA